MKALELLKKADYLSHKPGLTFNNSERITTIFGGLMTSAILAVMAVGAVLFGKEILLRENPISRKSNKLFDTSPVPLADNPIMFYVTDHLAKNLVGTKDFEESFEVIAQVVEVSVTKYPDTSSIMYYTLAMKRCTEDLIGQYASLYKETGLNTHDFLCIDKSTAIDMFGQPAEIDLVVNNPYGDIESKSIRVSFMKCDQKKSPGCWKYGDEFSISVGFSVFDDFLDTNDYSSPIKKNVYFHNSRISSGLFVNSKIHLNLNELETDSGLILKDSFIDTWFSFGSLTNEIEQFSENVRNFYSFNFSSNKVRNIYFRRYTKVQEVLAYLSGFFKLLTLIGQSCSKMVSKHVLYNSIVQLDRTVPAVNVTKTNASVNNFIKTTKIVKVANYSSIMKPQKLGFWRFLLGSLSCSRSNSVVVYKKEAFKTTEISYLKKKFDAIDSKFEELVSLKENN